MEKYEHVFPPVLQRMEEHYKELKETTGLRVISTCLCGSQNYGLELPTSDVDTKTIVLPTFREVALDMEPISYTFVFANNEHSDLKDLRLMMKNFRKQNPAYLEILFTPYNLTDRGYEWLTRSLRGMAEDIAHLDEGIASNTMMGQIREKMKGMLKAAPSTEENIALYGYDGKNLCHLLRMERLMALYFQGYSYPDCLNPHRYGNRDLIMAAKRHELTKEQAVEAAVQAQGKAEELWTALRDRAKPFRHPRYDEIVQTMNDLTVQALEQRFGMLK